jgi:hypothetical protein
VAGTSTVATIVVVLAAVLTNVTVMNCGGLDSMFTSVFYYKDLATISAWNFGSSTRMLTVDWLFRMGVQANWAFVTMLTDTVFAENVLRQYGFDPGSGLGIAQFTVT